MEQTSFLAPAVQCVAALQANLGTQAQLFNDPLNTSLASAISMLAYTAQFIERTVQQSSKLHDIGILIACQVKGENPNSSSKETFMLWNSISDQTERGRPSPQMSTIPQSSRQFEQHSNVDPKLDIRPDSTRQLETDQNGQPSQIISMNALQRKGQHQPSSGECSYVVPVGIAAKCLGFLLDGSGFSSHKNIFQKRSYTELGTKPLVDVLKKVFKAESETRTNRNHSQSSTKLSTKEGMIYCDLLPDHLRKAQEHECITVSVPEISIEEKGNITIPQYMKVRMNIRKPDRNKKHQNFAVLCALLDHTGPTGICAKTLRDYARQGFTAEGCKRRKRYSTSSKSSCNGSASSCQGSRQLCSFYISSDKNAIGKGTVDPYATEIDGKRITKEYVLVRFTESRRLEDISFPSDLSMEQRKSLYNSWMNETLAIWPTSGIERIELLGDYGRPIATGIFVQHLIQNDAHESVLKRIRRSSNNRNMDVMNAIIVCNVVLTLENNH